MAGKQHEIRTELRKLLEDSEAENLALKKLILALHEEEARARVAGGARASQFRIGNIHK